MFHNKNHLNCGVISLVNWSPQSVNMYLIPVLGLLTFTCKYNQYLLTMIPYKQQDPERDVTWARLQTETLCVLQWSRESHFIEYIFGYKMHDFIYSILDMVSIKQYISSHLTCHRYFFTINTILYNMWGKM